MNIRRSAAALAASAVLCAGAAPAAFAAPSTPFAPFAPSAPSPAASAPPVIPSGLYGKNDPTYDGVWRQSVALLAQHTVGVKPAKEAVAWLAGQQCVNGGFASFRADAAAACDATTMYDTNATAMAVQALKTLGGQDAAVKKSVDWLKSVQNEDGGWAFVPGSPSDANSTAVVVSALTVAGEKPAEVKSKAGKSAYEGLLAFRLGCAAQPPSDGGAFAYQPADGKLLPNADATAAATLAALGKGAVVAPAAKDTPAGPSACAASAEPDAAGLAGAGYLAEALKKGGDHLMAVTPGSDQPTADTGNTVDAVIALAAAGHKQSAAGALEWLKGNSSEWAKGSPAALGTLVLAAHATGTDPKAFGGTDLVSALNATGPAPQAAGTPEPSGTKDDNDGKKTDSDDQNIWWMIGAGAAAGAGIGILLSGRRKKNQL
ncbi:prenyltransferase/squalene oxidase repeat-containing protein [Streptomyces sp. NPDC090445]|uniref:prenyltransferase/squalene oxidase repeat-containing protein n=1 Tax=Streptomyces sp. NPDC090445 TaxID=3365963 RepID=UPI0037FD9C28